MKSHFMYGTDKRRQIEIGKYQKYGELFKNSVESYPLRDKIVLVMKDMVWVEQALVMGAKKQEHQ